MDSPALCPISGESEQEERYNMLTHLVGLALSVVGSLYLVRCAAYVGDFKHLISCSIFGATLVMLYAASTYYHACRNLIHKRVLRIIDHACIFLLIAGTYTPFSLGPLRNDHGWNLLCIEWSMATVGIAIKIFAFDRFKFLSVIAYLVMGWLVVFSLPLLMEELPGLATTWLISGGILYSLGVLFYLWENLPYNHTIWHVFVLGGSLCHYCSIYSML